MLSSCRVVVEEVVRTMVENMNTHIHTPITHHQKKRKEKDKLGKGKRVRSIN